MPTTVQTSAIQSFPQCTGLSRAIGVPAADVPVLPQWHPALVEVLTRVYRPAGTRQKILLTTDCPAEIVSVARQLVASSHRDPDREVCLLQPRTGEATVRPEDLAEFIVRYGHEYSFGFLAATLSGSDPPELADISQKAAAAGMPIGWDLTHLAHRAGEEPAPVVTADFALCRHPDHGSGAGAVHHRQQVAAEPEPVIDEVDLRKAMARFATGVAMVSTLHGDEFFAAPVNSLTSVSLDPPLLLVCFKHGSRTGRAMVESGQWAISVLAEHQEDISRRLAVSQPLSNGSPDDTLDGVPVLPGSIARLRCRTEQVVSAGDHMIIIGRVTKADADDGDPLLFFGSRYHRLTSS